jgi:ABC-type transport system involved in cytochrome bd biosynthesis fused ATPase/permease subunit
VTGHFQSFARKQADYASADIIRDSAPAAHFAEQAHPVETSWQTLRVNELTFRHPESRQPSPTLDGLSFNLQRGKRYALIGGSGSGKSTLLRILAGLYAADSVVLNLQSTRLDSPDAVAQFMRASSTLIPQDAEVFEGTLAENLGLCESLTGPPAREHFTRALELAQATEFVGKTSDDETAAGKGLDVVIAERGANWSGGQRSRVALARGILAAQGSALILLDEPTASLDPRTEAKVYEAIFGAFPEACIVSSVHRLNLLDRFDEVLVMREGRLLAQGSVAQLNASSPEFQQLMSAYSKSVGAVEPM